MPVIKYATLPTARMEAYNNATQYEDLAVLDFSTQGHGVFNCGNLTRLEPLPVTKSAYTAHITEVDIALGNISKLKNAVNELADKGYKNIYLMQSSLASVLGLDLNSYAEECSLEFGVRVFTSEFRLHDDCFVGAQEILYALSGFATNGIAPKAGFNLLGGRYTQENKRNHKHIAQLIEKELGLQLKFDSLNANSLDEWKSVSGASLNVVTSKCAIKTAEILQRRYGTPYTYFMPFGKDGEDRGLHDISQAVNGKYSPLQDEVYNLAVTQFRNVMANTSTKFVCYSDADRLGGLRDFFDSIGVSAEYFCCHSDKDFTYLDINDFIEKYCDKDYLNLSYDRVCKYMKKSVVMEKLGLDYKLLTPLCNVTCGKDGAYYLMEKCVDAVID